MEKKQGTRRVDASKERREEGEIPLRSVPGSLHDGSLSDSGVVLDRIEREREENEEGRRVSEEKKATREARKREERGGENLTHSNFVRQSSLDELRSDHVTVDS